MRTMTLRLLALACVAAVVTAFLPHPVPFRPPISTTTPTKKAMMLLSRSTPRGPSPLKMGLFGPTEEELAAEEEKMKGMTEQERLNYMSWKETNQETNAMTFVSVLGLIPMAYLLWVALTSE